MYFTPVWKTSLRFGVIGGVLSIALFLLLSFLDQNPLNKGKYFDFFLMLFILLTGLKYFRDAENQRRMKFIQGVGVGLATSFVVGALTSGFLWIYLAKIDPTTLDLFKDSGIQYLLQNRAVVLEDIDQDTLDKTIQEIKSLSVNDMVLDDILRKLIIGLFLSTILSVFLRK